MMEKRIMKNIIRPALSLLLLMSILTGLVYPVLVTGIAQWVFPAQAHGSLIERDGKVVGASLIGQNFAGNDYFWGRLSATSPQPNNATASGGSNLGPLNPALIDAVKARIDALRGADPTATGAVPVDLVTASASGLDPHISVAAAQFQVARVAAARKLPVEQLRALVEAHTQRPLLSLLGQPVVNVLELNLALRDLH